MTAINDTRSILSDLIAFPTISADSNLELIDYARERLELAGARVQLWRDQTGTKANLFASLGPETDGGIVLSGHSDVVPVEGQDWTSDPFRMVERDGKLFGRGSCDMKGFIAACLALVPEFAELELRRPLHFAFTYDEEVGCLGGRALIKDLASAGIKPSAVLIGEPTSMKVVEGHKGSFEYTVRFAGLEGHGSLPDLGVNAIEYAMRYISNLMEIREHLKNSTPKASRFTPPYSTIQVGRIEGGVAHNVIPGNCVIDWEFRPVHEADIEYVKCNVRDYVQDELLPAMRSVYDRADIQTEIVGEVRGLEPVDESEARDIALALTGETYTGVISFGTEAGLFQQAGISAVVCGPGSIEQAHKADEFVSLDQLQQCLDMLGGLKRQLV